MPQGRHARGRVLPALPAPLANAPGQCNAGVPAGSVLARFAAIVSFLTANKFHVVRRSPPYPNLRCAARGQRAFACAPHGDGSQLAKCVRSWTAGPARGSLRAQGAAADGRADAAGTGPERIRQRCAPHGERALGASALAAHRCWPTSARAATRAPRPTPPGGSATGPACCRR